MREKFICWFYGIWFGFEGNIWIVCYYHVTYEFQSESALFSSLVANKLLARNRRYIWSLSDSNGIGNHKEFLDIQAIIEGKKRMVREKWLIQ